MTPTARTIDQAVLAKAFHDLDHYVVPKGPTRWRVACRQCAEERGSDVLLGFVTWSNGTADPRFWKFTRSGRTRAIGVRWLPPGESQVRCPDCKTLRDVSKSSLVSCIQSPTAAQEVHV